MPSHIKSVAKGREKILKHNQVFFILYVIQRYLNYSTIFLIVEFPLFIIHNVMSLQRLQRFSRVYSQTKNARTTSQNAKDDLNFNSVTVIFMNKFSYVTV